MQEQEAWLTPRTSLKEKRLEWPTTAGSDTRPDKTTRDNAAVWRKRLLFNPLLFQFASLQGAALHRYRAPCFVRAYLMIDTDQRREV